MTPFTRALVVWWLSTSAAAIVHERFVAVETGAVLNPRHYPFSSPGLPLGRRQVVCDPGSHPCNDIGPIGATYCCANDQYCVIDPNETTTGACCHIGAGCGPCPETAYQCDRTQTVTRGGTTTTSVVQTCCRRSCTETSMFQCAESFGGGCCSYGSTCASGGLCISTLGPTTTPLLTPVPDGCTTGQISCPASLGGGCCADTQSCTLIDNRAHCADAVLQTPTGGGPISVIEDDPGLSAGAKAGVAVGVVVGCGLILGAATWWCLRRRKEERRRRQSEGGGGGGSGSPRPRPANVIGRVVGGASGSGRGRGAEMTDEAFSDMMSRSGSGVVQDYFGPEPAVGPYSDTSPHSASAVTTPGPEQRERGGVPLQPHEPGDIAVPVEIDSRLSTRGPGAERAPAAAAARVSHHGSDHADERYELYGSDPGQVSPYLSSSPYTGEMPSPPDERPR